MNSLDDATARYAALVNERHEHSLWSADLPVPPGWRAVHTGSRADCLEYIDRAWSVGPGATPRASDRGA